MTDKLYFDEMTGAGSAGEGGYGDGPVRDAYGAVRPWLDAMSQRQISAKRKAAGPSSARKWLGGGQPSPAREQQRDAEQRDRERE